MDFNAMHKQRKFVLIFAALGIISAFLPWYKLSILSINGLHDSGVIVFLAFIACGVMAWLGDQKTNLNKNAWLITLGAGAVAILFCIIFIIRWNGAGDIGGSIGLGLILATICSAGILYGAYMFRGEEDNLKNSLNDMKKNVENKIDNTPNT